MSPWDDWAEGDEPAERGWYAVLCCWDVDEGIAPSADQWDGVQWATRTPIIRHSGPFASESEAFDCA